MQLGDLRSVWVRGRETRAQQGQTRAQQDVRPAHSKGAQGPRAQQGELQGHAGPIHRTLSSQVYAARLT